MFRYPRKRSEKQDQENGFPNLTVRPGVSLSEYQDAPTVAASNQQKQKASTNKTSGKKASNSALGVLVHKSVQGGFGPTYGLKDEDPNRKKDEPGSSPRLGSHDPPVGGGGGPSVVHAQGPPAGANVTGKNK